MISVYQDQLPSEFFKFAQYSCPGGKIAQQHRWKFYKLVRIYARRFGNWPPVSILPAILDKAKSNASD